MWASERKRRIHSKCIVVAENVCGKIYEIVVVVFFFLLLLSSSFVTGRPLRLLPTIFHLVTNEVEK